MKTYTAKEIADMLQQEGDKEATLRMVRYYTQYGYIPELSLVGNKRAYTDLHLDYFRAIRGLKKTGEKLEDIQKKLRSMDEQQIRQISSNSIKLAYELPYQIYDNRIHKFNPDVSMTFGLAITTDQEKRIIEEVEKLLQEILKGGI